MAGRRPRRGEAHPRETAEPTARPKAEPTGFRSHTALASRHGNSCRESPRTHPARDDPSSATLPVAESVGASNAGRSLCKTRLRARPSAPCHSAWLEGLQQGSPPKKPVPPTPVTRGSQPPVPSNDPAWHRIRASPLPHPDFASPCPGNRRDGNSPCPTSWPRPTTTFFCASPVKSCRRFNPLPREPGSGSRLPFPSLLAERMRERPHGPRTEP